MMVGSLFSGYGGLDMAVRGVLGGQLAWVSDIEPGPSAILAHHHPGVPNLGDITAIDFADVAPVDVIAAGWPCQPFSHAGRRKGAADERALWPHVARAVRMVRPRLVVLENVPGIVPAGELARAVGDLAVLGYLGSWLRLRASDVGAPHQRARIFIVATDAEDLGHERRGVTRRWRSGPADRRDDALTLLPTPRATDGTKGGPNQRGSSGDLMLPSVARLLPTPTAMDSQASGGEPGSPNVTLTDATVRRRREWGDYARAIARWESVTGREAPPPTEPTGRNGAHRLAPRFVEWLMGLPAGHVTDVPGLTRNAQLRALGNGVVPQQAAAAITHLLVVQPEGKN